MREPLKDYINALVVEQLMNTNVGDQIQNVKKAFEQIQECIWTLAEKQDEMDMTQMKVLTMLTFAILRKIGEGKHPAEFTTDDWKEIGKTAVEYGIVMDDRQSSAYVFYLYERYIRFSADMIEPYTSSDAAQAVRCLADELSFKRELLETGGLDEVTFIEDSLWISLDAMVKLLASLVYMTGVKEIGDFTHAVATLAVEYGRFMLYQKELAMVDSFVEQQNELDEALSERYSAYREKLEEEAEQFYTLIDNAFAPDFRDVFLKSILLAQAAGVTENEILSSEDDIDDFFLN